MFSFQAAFHVTGTPFILAYAKGDSVCLDVEETRGALDRGTKV